jgi:ABC-2 type transport system ATP-binding protein
VPGALGEALGPAVAGARREGMSDLAIATEGLSKRYGGVLAVDDLWLRVHRGEIYGLLGANGAGKTTTILMLLGIIRSDGGTVRLFGRALSGEPLELRRQVGVVCEGQSLYPDMTTAEYLGFFARLYDVDQPRRRIGQVLERVGLAARADSEARSLSRGLQQKLGLARALLHEPPLLILDEPMSGLDPLGIREVREILLAENARGTTILMSSHVLPEVERIAHRVGVLVDGRLLADGTVADLHLGLHAPVRLTLELERADERVVSAVAALPFVTDLHSEGRRLDVTFGGRDHRAEVSRTVVRAGGVIVGMATGQRSLEDVFVALAAGVSPQADTAGADRGPAATIQPAVRRVTARVTRDTGRDRTGARPDRSRQRRVRAAGAIARRELLALRRSPTPLVALVMSLGGGAIAGRSALGEAGGAGPVAEPGPLYLPLFIAVLVLTAALAFIGTTSVARERESGTLEVLFYGPVDATAFVAGKFAALVMAYLGLGFAVAVALLAVAGAMGVRFGADVLLALPLSVLSAAHAGALGLALSALAASVRSAVLVLVAVAWVTLAIHGGAAIFAALPAQTGTAADVAAAFDAANRALSLVSPYAHLDRAVQAARTVDPGPFAVAVASSAASTAALLMAAVLGLRRRGVRRP